jgi:hypothetical protein
MMRKEADAGAWMGNISDMNDQMPVMPDTTPITLIRSDMLRKIWVDKTRCCKSWAIKIVGRLLVDGRYWDNELDITTYSSVFILQG